MSHQADMMLDPAKRQIFPVVYPGMGQFLQDNEPSGSAGAVARVEIPVSNNPVMITGIRALNVYEVPSDLQNSLALPYLKSLDSQQTIRTDLSQQNIIVRPTSQGLVCGGPGYAGEPIHWHPLESPYPFRGGNNIDLEFVRETSYPDAITAVMVKVAIVGWMYMSDAVPAAGPPSTGFYVPQG